MNIVDFELEYQTSVDVVRDAYWRLETWPEITEHVKDIVLHYEDDLIQVLTMTVASGDKRSSFKSVRALAGDTIYYYQPEPPPFLRQHYGLWQCLPSADGSIVKSRHYFEVVPDEVLAFARKVQGVPGVDDPVVHIANLLRHNSQQTMEALKRRLESPQASARIAAGGHS